jgi:hypothetical protein
MSELSHFEEESIKTPVKQPYAILIGCALLPIVLWILSALTPTQAVKDLKQADETKPAAAAQAVDDGDEI